LLFTIPAPRETASWTARGHSGEAVRGLIPEELIANSGYTRSLSQIDVDAARIRIESDAVAAGG
jgi:hypothetical protein